MHLLWVGTSMQGARSIGNQHARQIDALLPNLCNGCSVTLPWLSEYNPVVLGQVNSNDPFMEVYSMPGTLTVSHV